VALPAYWMVHLGLLIYLQGDLLVCNVIDRYDICVVLLAECLWSYSKKFNIFYSMVILVVQSSAGDEMTSRSVSRCRVVRVARSTLSN